MAKKNHTKTVPTLFLTTILRETSTKLPPAEVSIHPIAVCHSWMCHMRYSMQGCTCKKSCLYELDYKNSYI